MAFGTITSLAESAVSYVRGAVAFYGALSAKIAGVWLSVWLIRRKGEFDYPLDGTARIVRWVAVGVFFLIGYVRGAQLGYVRLASAALGLGFLCWPNFAYRLTNLFRRGDPKPSIEGPS
jgi:hypothetical protein